MTTSFESCLTWNSGGYANNFLPFRVTEVSDHNTTGHGTRISWSLLELVSRISEFSSCTQLEVPASAGLGFQVEMISQQVSWWKNIIRWWSRLWNRVDIFLCPRIMISRLSLGCHHDGPSWHGIDKPAWSIPCLNIYGSTKCSQLYRENVAGISENSAWMTRTSKQFNEFIMIKSKKIYCLLASSSSLSARRYIISWCRQGKRRLNAPKAAAASERMSPDWQEGYPWYHYDGPQYDKISQGYLDLCWDIPSTNICLEIIKDRYKLSKSQKRWNYWDIPDMELLGYPESKYWRLAKPWDILKISFSEKLSMGIPGIYRDIPKLQKLSKGSGFQMACCDRDKHQQTHF